jgi:BON domain-containing protein
MMKRLFVSGLVALSLAANRPVTQAAQDKTPVLKGPSTNNEERTERHLNMLGSAIRHELFTLPYYDVFDWLEAELTPDGHVTLRGEVVRPTTADDAEKRIRRLESVSDVRNQIKVLPVGSHDDALRVALYRAIYNWDSPLFRYATRAMPPIHILVEDGHVTLKGAVATESESQLAYFAARQVPGTFEVRNELRVDN